MRKISLYILLAFFNVAIATKTIYGQSSPKIELSDLLIARTGQQSFIKLGFSKNEVIKILGKPETDQKSYFVKFDLKGEMLLYDGAKFYFVDNGLEAFELINSQFSIKIKDRPDKAVIGKHLTGFKRATDRLVEVVLQNHGEPWDEVLNITLGSKQRVEYITCGPD